MAPFVNKMRRIFLMVWWLWVGSIAKLPAQAFYTDSASVPEEQQYLQSVVMQEPTFSEKEWASEKSKIEFRKGGSETETPLPKSTGYNFHGLLEALKYIFYAALLCALAYVLWRLLMLADTPNKADVASRDLDFAPIPETQPDLMAINTDLLIQEAMENADYPNVVKMLYIKTLQQLVKARQLEWRHDKTNRQILFQVRNSPFITGLNQIFLRYEQVCFGRMAIDREGLTQFTVYQAEVQALIDKTTITG